MEYLIHIITFLAGLGTGWTLKVVISNRVVTQNGNTVGGDMAAGDINKHNKG